jgi:two-component system sensor histidine kinase RegB
MHPEIALHMRGMWLAFALTALIIAVLVARLAMAVERRDQALETLRDRTARTARAASLATLAAGAAHELSTPLSTIAVAAHELERTLTDRRTDPDLQQDARLIRAETERCRQILDAMAATSGNPAGETPRSVSIADIVAGLRVRLNPAETDRVRIDAGPSDAGVLWPVNIVTRALANIVQNALQASAAAVEVEFRAVPEDSIQITVVDRGAGMSAEDLGRAGDPFFTTKPPGRGTGLGLFVARSSIEQLGGRLSLSSRPGHGTSAVIILPVNVVLPVASDHE